MMRIPLRSRAITAIVQKPVMESVIGFVYNNGSPPSQHKIYSHVVTHTYVNMVITEVTQGSKVIPHGVYCVFVLNSESSFHP